MIQNQRGILAKYVLCKKLPVLVRTFSFERKRNRQQDWGKIINSKLKLALEVSCSGFKLNKDKINGLAYEELLSNSNYFTYHTVVMK